MLAGCGVGDRFLGGGQWGGKLGAVAAVGLPGDEDNDRQQDGYEDFCEL
jgi:hypothetical protein